MSDNKLRKLPFILGTFLLYIAVICPACVHPSSSVNAVPNQVEYNPQTVLDEMQRFNLTGVGEPLVQSISLPDDFTDLNWGIKASACEAGGYDLSPYAGQTAFLTEYALSETYMNEPLKAYVISQGNQVICAYKAVSNSSSLAPGVFAIDASVEE
jgi:hypothetical protein